MLPVILSGIISQSRLSREQIAERMSDASGQEVTVAMLNAWTAESKRLHRFPLEFTPAFCRAVGNNKLIEALLKEMSLVAISEKDQLLFEILKNENSIAELKRRNARLKRKFQTGQLPLFEEVDS